LRYEAIQNKLATVFSPLNRRNFLKKVAGATAALSLGRNAFTYAEDSILKAAPLTADLSLVSGAGGNVVVLNASDGLLLINGGLPDRTTALLKFLDEQFKGKRVTTVFNTDWHLEHTGSNEALRKLGAKILAHENTKLWIGADFYSEWENKRYKPRPGDALPTDTFYTNGGITFGNQRIEYGYMAQAHTDGDIYLHFPQQNVLVVGDVLSVGQYPILDYVTGGWLGGLQNANQALLKVANAETRIVPGSGPVQTRADLQAQADMCAAMRDRLVRLMRQGMGPQDMIAAAPSKDFDAKWGNPELFIKNAYRGMWGHVRELGGIV
jgi:glyoxylase-like metal-dependent hydrolase (beta-lactamase superfamily II)